MTTEPEDDEAPSPATLAQIYLVVGLIAVVGLGVALLQQGSEPWAYLPPLVGAAGLIFRWRLGSLIVFATTAAALLAPSFFQFQFRPRRLATPLSVDLLTCAAALIYTVAHQRILALEWSLFPADPRRAKSPPPSRSIDSSALREVPGVLIACAAATVVAFILWEASAAIRAPLSIKANDWRVGQVIWVVSFGLVVVAGAISYLGMLAQSRDEAELYLRDEFWRETRREQRRIFRWRAYGRRLRERKGRV